ncbi:DUF4266 domain-containing protein [Reinekea sp.]|uniref:DUF4266 domain-containing protein n=1 Tax=Reinekea sp. TaxID=1970455 RepID=UPI002A836958|nr:DUF4266 domain-containing protein [Reinekea sp.]
MAKNQTLSRSILVICCFTLLLSSCTSLGVKPWQRGTLARMDMTFGSDALNGQFDNHIYFSKEAASGGSGQSGGGCGCN